MSQNAAAAGGSNETNSNVQSPQSTWGEVVSFFKTLGFILALAFGIRVTIVEPFKIPSGSMIPTLEIGDFILVIKFNYGLRMPFMTRSAVSWGAPSRGDVVVLPGPMIPILRMRTTQRLISLSG